jgi:hypothetical protein
MSRPISPFIAFCKANRDEVKAANPNANFGDIAKILTTLWKEKCAYVEPRHDYVLRERAPASAPAPANEPELRRSARLRNKRLGLNFWGCKINNKK